MLPCGVINHDDSHWCFASYVKVMKSYKYLSCLLAFVDLLVPTARLSVFLQGDAMNLMMAKTSTDTTKKSLHSAANVHSEELTNLIQQTETADIKFDASANR